MPVADLGGQLHSGAQLELQRTGHIISGLEARLFA
jgi:hypothetical protein